MSRLSPHGPLTHGPAAATPSKDDRIAALEQRLVAQMADGHEHQRKALRLTVRKILHALSEEEEQRASIEASNEIKALEAEIASRAEALSIHRSMTARLGEFGERQAGRLQELQRRMEAAVQQHPSSEHEQQVAIGRFAAEVHAAAASQTRAREDALQSAEQQRLAHEAEFAALESRVHAQSAEAGVTLREMARAAAEAVAQVEASGARADESMVRLQQEHQAEIDRVVAQMAGLQRGFEAERRRDQARISTAAKALQAAVALVSDAPCLVGGPSVERLRAHAQTMRRLSEQADGAPAAAETNGAAYGTAPSSHASLVEQLATQSTRAQRLLEGVGGMCSKA